MGFVARQNSDFCFFWDTLLDIKFCFIIDHDFDGNDDGDEDGTDHYPYDASDVTWRSLLENKAEDGRYETVISSPAFT